MEYIIIIGVLVAIFVIVLLLKLIKNIVKTLITFGIIVLVISVVIGGFVFIDTRNFVQGIREEENIFLLNDYGFISGFVLDNMNKTVSISNSQLEKYDEYYEDEKYDPILEDKYKFFIFNVESLEDEKNQEYVDFLKGIATEFEVEGDYDHIPNPKTVAFIALVVNNLKSDPLYLVNSYRDGNLTIYPESITFKLIKLRK